MKKHTSHHNSFFSGTSLFFLLLIGGLFFIPMGTGLAQEGDTDTLAPIEAVSVSADGGLVEPQEVQETLPDSPVYHEPILHVFHSKTCPHCRNLLRFLDKKIAPKYPALDIRLYDMSDESSEPILRKLGEQYGATQYLGMVPLAFIGPKYFVGFDSDLVTGKAIEEAVVALLGDEAGTSGGGVPAPGYTRGQKITIPFFGEIDPNSYSLPALAILLGFLDGFNVCSLGALVLIIGLTLKLQRRRAIVLFGGAFLLTTALVYGLLIFLWYKLFATLGAYLDIMTTLIALLSLGGGLYFLKEYFRMRKQGAVCEFTESRIIQKLTEHTGRAFENTGRLFTILGAVIMFAAVVAIVEFPCSAAVPMIFAGLLADMGLGTAGSLPYIGLFILFYLLDEILIFGIAAYKLKVWMTSGTFTKWAVLAEAIILIGIAIYYLGTLAGAF